MTFELSSELHNPMYQIFLRGGRILRIPSLIFGMAFIFISGFGLESNWVHAGFIFDDFDDYPDSDSTPLEGFRTFFDYTTLPGGSSEDLFGVLSLSQNSGFEAVLQYKVTGGYNYSDYHSFVLNGTDLEFIYDEPVSVRLIADSIEIASGVQEYDVDFVPFVTFAIVDDLSSVETLSFHFTTTGTDPFFVSSESLVGFGTVQAVPEPTSLLLIGVALMCGGTYRLARRRQRANDSTA